MLYLGLKEGLVECATLCVKSEDILTNIKPKLFSFIFIRLNTSEDVAFVHVQFITFRSRRPEARPSTSLVLQLMDFEEKLRLVSNKTKQSSLGSKLLPNLKSFFHLDWRGKIKLAIPLSIYLMIAMLVVKIIYEVLFDQDSRSIFTGKLRQKMEKTSDDDLVCF